MKKLQITIAACLLCGSVMAFAQDPGPAVKAMQATYEKLYAQCRGGAGDDMGTSMACKSRDALAETLQSFGWCYRVGWTQCKPESLKKSGELSKN